ncbi:dihydrofolate synthase/folylpolyglutamate synthase [Microbacteriaceae bacterium SG_E_30_P1]|uniref:tetrahydrofolate synthase n=1 Tax=Antiquaquibacter oligotrophicus TaxID=2880260 RepID=A0ABT6KQ40_9MICO|nr:folylpolyglutamate synthase/dihydrofolate synthase family protein [Antiquaquibacter oligotrophicus]MDH6181227.1 dihydrofolate synthase/folylpolyglutamate synthase [Antiquaquibacter oligotrophicus]UDF13078.1 bifunctional folylpolyglutamate synthase/dihydrofolate synthase [Antiquaquibacter oligotrophicus]
MSDEYAFDDSEFAENAERAYEELLERIGEGSPQPRLEPTRRVVELLGDPQRSYPIIHITGTNGKTSVARLIESILRAYGLRTGLATSPHLRRPNERIMIDGEPISNRAFAENWADVRPYIDLVDAELRESGEEPLTYFECLTVLTFASFADAPVDVAVVEVGMGGEWDSTNVGDGQVAVFTPIALDHTQRLGATVQQIARTKSGIIKPVAAVVSAAQSPEALGELERATDLTESTLRVEGDAFALESSTVAVGGQVISVKGLAGEYRDLFLPLYGTHQGHNAALAIAAVESFLGRGSQALVGDVLEEGLATVASPGRLQLVGTDPTVLVDAAHNPHGAQALADALRTYFTFDEIVVVLGVLSDKDATGIVEALAPVASSFIATQSESDRAIPAADLADLISRVAPDSALQAFESLEFAVQDARVWAAQAPRRAVLVTGSITLIGEVLGLSEVEGWK